MDFEKIILKAWEDEAFKRALLQDPRGCLESELGMKLPDGLQIFIHEQTPTCLHLILPMKPDAD